MSDGPIRSDNSKFLLKISFISNGSFKGASQANPVLRVNPFPKYVQGRLGVLRIEPENSEMFLRPGQLSFRCIPSPTPRVTEPLTFCEECLTATNGLFSPLALSDVNHSTGELDKIAARAENRMTNAMNVPERAIGMHNAIIQFFV